MLAVVAVAQCMVVLDASDVNVALRAVQRNLGFSEQNPLAVTLLPRLKRDVDGDDADTVALASARCPGAPNAGHRARLVASGQRIRECSGRPDIDVGQGALQPR